MLMEYPDAVSYVCRVSIVYIYIQYIWNQSPQVARWKVKSIWFYMPRVKRSLLN